VKALSTHAFVTLGSGFVG